MWKTLQQKVIILISNCIKKFRTKTLIGNLNPLLARTIAKMLVTVNMPVDKVKHRLEQLDQDDEETKMLKVTQADYVKGIDNFHKDLIETWETEKRVKSLKTAIKVRATRVKHSIATVLSQCRVALTSYL